MTVDRVVANGRLVTGSGVRKGALAIDNGEIVAIGRDIDTVPEARDVVDASELLVMPGVVDPHVHLADHVSEDSYASGTRAAALGGVTTCIDFAWQSYDEEPGDRPGSLIDGIEAKQANRSEAVIDIGLHGGILREDESVLSELQTAIDRGVTSFKAYTAYEFGVSNGFLSRLFEEAAALNAVVLVHTEDDSVCQTAGDRLRKNGRTEPTDYPHSRPPHAEAMAAENATRLAIETGVNYYGVHTSCRDAADAIARSQSASDTIRTETCTHYATLDEGVHEAQGSLPRIAPPIRPPEDTDALFEHIQSGTISIVSTDHVGQTRERKESSEWWEGPFGANSLQVSLPVFHDEAVNKRGLSYPLLVRLLCANPARTFGLPRKGTLEVGTDADLVLFDPDEQYTISADQNASIADYSIYEGRRVTGSVKQTYLRGEVIADDGYILAEPGYGEFVHRERPDWEDG